MTELELANLSVRLYRLHLDLIERAAALEPGRSVSDYVRMHMPSIAAHDLGVPLPHVPPVTRGRSGSIVAQAAHKLGITPAELTERASRLYAAQTLGYDGPTSASEIPPPPHPTNSLARSARTSPPPRKR